MKENKSNTKRLFVKLGSCSHLLFHILNREFGNPKEAEEHASNLLAGGIYKLGYQCGMLWGASLAAGAEAFRRYNDRDKAMAVAIRATRHLMKSFFEKTKSIECYDITNCNWSSKMDMAKYLFMAFMSQFPHHCLFTVSLMKP